MVALLRDPQEGWYWNKGETRDFTQVSWRQDVPQNPKHMHAMLTVQTVIIKETEYDYVAYNYDHYIDVDPDYQWFGFTTSDNKANHRLGTYYICSYTIKPQVQIEEVENTTVAHVEENKDPCFCAANERIELSELDSHAIFTSPRYPNNYCSDNHCKWTITTEEGLSLQIEWLVFSTEKNMDFVYVYDGDDDDSPLMQSCSATDCDDHKSSGPAMQVHFSADHVITQLGFKFKVTAIKPDACYCSESLHMSITNSGETFIFNSPRHPEPYCSNLACGWTISAPEGHVVDIKWDRFETENHRGYLLAFEQSDGIEMLKQNCTGTTCLDLRSSGQEIRVEFVSDSHMSKAVGFRAIARVIKNYCAMHVHKVPSGTITSNEPPRDDGYIAAGTKVTVTCPQNYKIRNTVEEFTDSAICVAPQWSKLLEICVPVCQLEYSVKFSMDNINFCSFGQNLQTTLVEKGHNVQVSTYDSINGNILRDRKIYKCGESGWVDEPPACHPIGILSLSFGIGYSAIGLDMYTPNDNMNTSRLLRTELLSEIAIYDIATAYGGGPILVMGEQKNRKGTENVELLDINKNMSTVVGAEMNEQREYFAAANLNGVIYACGGYGSSGRSNVCERFQKGTWSMSAPMNEQRGIFILVALGQWLYAIGGSVSSFGSTFVSSDTVERYSVGTSEWEYVHPMNRARENFAAATLDGSVFVCGGADIWITETCEQYSPLQDQWQYIASMNTQRMGFSLVAFDGALYALGGVWDFGLLETNTIEKYYHNEWLIVAQLTVVDKFVSSIVTSFTGNIPSDAERYQPQSLPYQVDLSALAKLTDTEPEWSNYAPIAIDASNSHVEGLLKLEHKEQIILSLDACACLSNEGIVLTGLKDSKTFQSPGYPDHYCNNNKCLWTISVSVENLAIQLEWVSFSTENQMDMAFIYEGSDDSVRLVHVCSGSHCSSHLSEESKMQVYFSSDHVATDIGFKARVTAVDPDPCHCYASKEIALASHIESYILLSPNHPNSYCTNVDYNCTWIITGLKGYGPEVVWDFFNLGDSDVLSIYNGMDLLEECVGDFCSDLVSPGEQLIINFTTTGSATEQNQQQAFSATISLVRNYCRNLTSDHGAIEYDREARADGHLPIGTQAVLTCPPNYTVTNAVEQRTSNLTCVSPHWDKAHQIACESVCQLSFKTPTSWDDMHLCTYNDFIPRTLVPHGHKIILEHHDFTNDVLLSETNFECRNMEWTPAPPTCHKLGIFVMSKGKFEIYWPMENLSTISDLKFGGDYGYDISVLLGHGRVLIGGGYEVSRRTHIIDLTAGQVSQGPMMREERNRVACASLGGEPYVCGGFDSSSCEVLRKGSWVSIAEMKDKRHGHAMVATRDALYVLGGRDYNLLLSSVEKYSQQTNRWTAVAAMPDERADCGAAEFNNVIYVCGGYVQYTSGSIYIDHRETKSCLKYDTHLDIWRHINDLPSIRTHFNMVVFGTRMFALGGQRYDFYRELYEDIMSIDGLDIQTEQWTNQGHLQLPGASAVLVIESP